MKTSSLIAFAALALGAFYLVSKATAKAANPPASTGIPAGAAGAVSTAASDLFSWLTDSSSNADSTNSGIGDTSNDNNDWYSNADY